MKASLLTVSASDCKLPCRPHCDAVWLEVHHDEGCEIYVNGKLLWREGGYLIRYKTVRLTPDQIRLFREGETTIAVHCRQTVGGQFIDVGFVMLQLSR